MAFRNLILCYQAFYHRRMMRMIFVLPYAQISIRSPGAVARRCPVVKMVKAHMSESIF